MRVCSTALLLTLIFFIHSTIAGDIYWEGEEDANEFLEFKKPESKLTGHLRRLKRQFFWPFQSASDTSTDEPTTEDQFDDNRNDADDIEPAEGSGTLTKSDLDNKEKTLRVNFVVMEPYLKEYSNRDSEQFRNISKGLADAVNALLNEVAGVQKTRLIRIQSRISDEFSCKVTMEIVTRGFEDTQAIAGVLQDHIRRTRQLGVYTVDEYEFEYTDITDPDAEDENQPMRRGDDDEPDPALVGADNEEEEEEEDNDDNEENACEPILCNNSEKTICKNQICNNQTDCPEGDDEIGCDELGPDQNTVGGTNPKEVYENETVPETTTPAFCGVDEFRCDHTRCLPLDRRCDRHLDCDDSYDELDCPPACFQYSSRKGSRGEHTSRERIRHRKTIH